MTSMRNAIKARATWFALMYKSFAQALPPDQVEKLARQAIYEFGRMKGQADGASLTPERWVNGHVKKGSALFFDSNIQVAPDVCVQQMNLCPLVEAWREMDCTPAELDLFCDIAMEGDRAHADVHGIAMDIPDRIGKGDSFCRLLLHANSK